MPGFIDTATEAGIGYSDLKHLSAYVNYGSDAGTNVLVPNEAPALRSRRRLGESDVRFFRSDAKVGEYYDPADGFISHPGIAGYALYAAKIWDFASNDKLVSVGVSGFLDRYQGPLYGQAQSDNSLQFDVLTKSAIDCSSSAGPTTGASARCSRPSRRTAGSR